MTNTDFLAVGLTLNIVGLYFIATSIVFKKPKTMIREFFGTRRRNIERVRLRVLNNVQVVIGVMIFFSGYCFQILGTLDLGDDQRSALFTRDRIPLLTGLLVAGVLVSTLLLRLLGTLWSKRAFRKLLKDFFKEHPECFTEDATVTKQIGELLSIPRERDTTVEEYVEKIRAVLDVPSISAADAYRVRKKSS